MRSQIKEERLHKYCKSTGASYDDSMTNESPSDEFILVLNNDLAGQSPASIDEDQRWFQEIAAQGNQRLHRNFDFGDDKLTTIKM